MSLAAALTVLAASPARASEAVHVPLGSSIGSLVAGPDGGAWIAVNGGFGHSTIARAGPDGSYRQLAAADALFAAALGPDGRAWFMSGASLLRVDAAGTAPAIEQPDSLAYALATGPDGTVWMTANGNQIARIAPDGTTTLGALRACRGRVVAMAITRASDGAMWIADNGCGLIRHAPDGRETVVKPPTPVSALAADASGGVWFASALDDFEHPTAGHVDATGRVSTLNTKRPWTDVAVAPDGSAWLAGYRCKLARAGADGRFGFVPAPIPAYEIEFDPAGGMWLASPARLVHDEPAGACDDEPPHFGIGPGHANRRGYGTVSLAALRRARGFRIRVREPATVQAYLSRIGDDEPFAGLDEIVTRPRTLRVAIGARRLRHLLGKELDLIVEGSDREGNIADQEVVLRVRP